MSELPGDQTHNGMIKKVGNLREMEAGDLRTLESVEKLKRENLEVNFRTIRCRWVTTRKTVDKIRSRIVVKDVAEKICRQLVLEGVLVRYLPVMQCFCFLELQGIEIMP